MSGIKTLSVISLGFTLRSSCCVMLFQWHYHRALKKHTKAWSASWLWSVCNSPGVLPDFMVLCVNRCVCAHVLTSWPTLCDPMDYSPTSSSAHGVFQSRMLEEKKKECWSRLPFPPGYLPHWEIKLGSLVFPALAGGFFTLHHLGSPWTVYLIFKKVK